jgi:copper transport protein
VRGVAGDLETVNLRRMVIVVAAVATAGILSLSVVEVAQAQGLHGGHSEQVPGHLSSSQLELLGGIDHGFTLAASALLAGLAPFVALVWLPAGEEGGAERAAIRPLGLLAWGLLYVLVFAGVGELAVYAMRASGELLSWALFREALLETRVGAVWLARLGFGFFTAAAISAAVRWGRLWLWWIAAGIGSLLLMTLTQLSHAAAEGRFLPFLADWVHAMAAAIWMGGLLGFVCALFSGPLGALDDEQRSKLRERSVRRFSTIAITAVLILGSTGLYAILLHIPSWEALVATPYGRALLVKLGLLAFVLTLGAANFLLRGRGPFGRLVVLELLVAFGVFVATGFLTSLPPASST